MVIYRKKKTYTKWPLAPWGQQNRDESNILNFPTTDYYLKNDLINEYSFRASLICGKLPAEEIRDIRSKLTKQMDVLNHLLQLDLVVR